MSPPKASLAKRTADSPKAASQSPAAAGPAVASRFGNEQMLTVLRERQAKASGAPSRDENADPSGADPWSALSPASRERTEELYAQCVRMQFELNDAQTAHASTLRTKWILGLSNLQAQINDIDSDAKLATVARAFDRYATAIVNQVADFATEWDTLGHRYEEERDRLLFERIDDTLLAAKRLENLYNESSHWITGAAGPYVTNEDYSDLKRTLESGSHRALGTLQSWRKRVRETHDLLDIVREVRVDGQDPEKYVPGWGGLVDDELADLDRLAKRAPASAGADFSDEYRHLRDDLRAQQKAVRQAISNENINDGLKALPTNRVPIAVGKVLVGAAEAIVSPFAEVARELLDEAQIGLYYVSGGRFEVNLTSDLMKAFAQGATRTEVLKGMAEGLIGTPGRLLKAAEDGDWEAVGKEAVNLYLLVETVKASPKYLRHVPALLATARKALRLVRFRSLGLRLRSPRLTVPKAPPVPREPVFLGHDPATGPTPPVPRYGPTATPPRHVGEPKYLTAPPEQSPVRTGEIHAPDTAPPATRGRTAPAEPVVVEDPAMLERARVQLRATFRRLLSSGEGDVITVEGVEFTGVRVTNKGGVLTVSFDILENTQRIPGRGLLIHGAFEEAARDLAREVRAVSVTVKVYAVQNRVYGATLQRLGYDWAGGNPKSMVLTRALEFSHAPEPTPAPHASATVEKSEKPDGGAPSHERAPATKRLTKDETHLLDDVVQKTRREVETTLEEAGDEFVPGQAHLSAECMGGACGFSRQNVARLLKTAGIPDGKIFMNQVRDIVGTGKHTFAVAEIAPGKHVLIDTTFAQFTGELDGAPRWGESILRKSGRVGAQIRNELTIRGYIELTDEIADVYVKAVGEVANGQFTVSDLARERASLAQNPDLLFKL